MKKFLVPLAILLVLTMLLAGCGDSETTTPAETATETTATTGTTTTPTTTGTGTFTTEPTSTATETVDKYGGKLTLLNALSPAANVGIPWETNNQKQWYTFYVYAEPLLAYRNDGSLEPWLATDWEISDDNLSITFYLREGVKFHDGSDFNAEVVKWQIDKNIEEETTTAANWESIEIIDDYTVKLNLKKWANSFWNNIGNDNNVCFISMEQYETMGEDYAREHPVGTGPFLLTEYKKDVHCLFEANPDYWQEGKPYLEEIEFLVVPDVVSQQMAMQAGTGHVMSLMDGKVLSEMAEEGFTIIQFPAGTSLLSPDSANPDSIYADIRIRQAIDYALDKEAIAEAVGYGYMFPSSQLPPLGHPHRPDGIPESEYDLDAAKTLLADAGYPDGFKTKLITWAYDIDYTLVVQQQLAKVGIEAEVENVDNLKFLDLWMNGWSDAMLSVSQSFGPNFAAAYSTQFPPYGNFNVSLALPDGLQEALDNALAAVDPEEQTKYNYEMVELLYEDMTVIVYMTGGLGSIIAPDVKDGGWLFGADKWHSWRPADCWLDD